MSVEDDTDEVGNEWESYSSGPFCRHWGDPGDCDTACTTCDHACHNHIWDMCDVEDCKCEEFTDEDSMTGIKAAAIDEALE